MAKEVWLSPGEALAHLGWSSDDKKAVAKLKNAFINRKEFEGNVETRQLHPSFPQTGKFVKREALDAYAQNLANEALQPNRKGGAANPNGPKVWRINLTVDQANELNVFLASQSLPQVYRYQAPKKERTGEPKKRGRKPRSESNGVAPASEPTVEMELIEA